VWLVRVPLIILERALACRWYPDRCWAFLLPYYRRVHECRLVVDPPHGILSFRDDNHREQCHDQDSAMYLCFSTRSNNNDSHDVSI
jgi:hypothetical protein